MSFLLGKQEQLSNVSPETGGLYKDLIGSIQGQGLDKLFPGTKTDQSSIQPYLDLFSMQNSRNFAQAKESSGNLTGSGLENNLGNATAKADTEQSAFLASLFERRRQDDANRFMQLIMSTLGSQAGSRTNVYRPGLLDYAGQGATALASGGAFNGLFGGDK